MIGKVSIILGMNSPPKMTELYITKRMRGKMTGMQSLNTSPYENSYCKGKRKNQNNICSKCYSFRALDSYLKDADGRWIDNGVLLSKEILEDDKIPIINTTYFRFNAHGELLNDIHLENLIKIAEENPRTIFALWSKRINLVRNCSHYYSMVFVYSNPKLNPDFNKRGIPYPFKYSFNVFTKEYAEKNEVNINCQSRCLPCLVCYTPDKYKYKDRIINEIMRK